MELDQENTGVWEFGGRDATLVGEILKGSLEGREALGLDPEGQ